MEFVHFPDKLFDLALCESRKHQAKEVLDMSQALDGGA